LVRTKTLFIRNLFGTDNTGGSFLVISLASMLKMNCRNLLLSVLLLVLALGSAHAQEVCNNALDDDGDGLIDLNDTTECACTGNIGDDGVTSIIPNPSFEQFDCVPTSFSELACATTWEQATAATSDYFLNVNGGVWFPNTPQPLPDGVGITGFAVVDSLDSDSIFYPYGEYLGACLLSPLQAGVQYSLQMALAGAPGVVFNDPNATFPIVAPFGPLDITIFGSATCPTFPVNVPPFTCPIGVGDWAELGAVSYTSNGSWQTVTITFTPAVDIQAVMIGPPCTIPNDYNQSELPYFLADDLVLNQTALFNTTVTASGSFCTDDLVLHATVDSAATGLQWYRDGIALVGQTDSTLSISALGLPPGTYQFRSSLNATACVISSITIDAPEPVAPIVQAAPLSGCPPLAVQFTEATADSVVACAWSFGDGDSATMCDPLHMYESSGTFDVTLTVTLANGCTYDTTYQDLVVVSGVPVAAFIADPQPATPDNTVINFTDQSTGGPVTWAWDFDTIPPFNSTDSNPTVTFPPIPGEYPVVLVVTNAAGCTDTLRSVIRVESNGEITLPNVFTPNGDGVNDRFLPFEAYPGRWRLTIHNRWGQALFTTDSVTAGWSGADAADGTYFWTLEALEGQTGNRRSGVVTLLRTP
jgi:gliding motility-associated-like protein